MDIERARGMGAAVLIILSAVSAAAGMFEGATDVNGEHAALGFFKLAFLAAGGAYIAKP